MDGLLYILLHMTSMYFALGEDDTWLGRLKD
jgi:hypothetical protein